MPLTASWTHLVSPVSVVIGPPLLLLTSIALLAGFLVLALAPWCWPLAVPFVWLLDKSLWLCDVLVTSADGWPYAYAYVGDRYALMPCGGSIGDGYGPLLIAGERLSGSALEDGEALVAVPGTLTTATLALRLFAPRARTRVVPFDRILDEVRAGRADAGLVIHEGQLTFAGHGLRKILDLGAWWKEQTGLPLPLGGNAVRRDLGDEMMARLTRLVRASVRYSLAHRAEALQYALGFARGMDPAVADRFVGMWVNEMTVDCGERGRRAVQELLARGHAAGLIPRAVTVDFVPA